MKKLLVVGLLVMSQFVFASYDRNQVAKLGPNVKKAVNTAFEKGCNPESLDELCIAFKIDNAEKIPALTTIVTEDIQKNYSLRNNQVIDIWNLSRQAIVESRKNKKPEGPGFWIALANALEQEEASHKMTYGEQRIDRKLDVDKRREAELAWQSNPDKISPATDKALEHCNNAIITSNYELNPTWQNWALTYGVDGRFLAASAVLITVSSGALFMSLDLPYNKLDQSVRKNLEISSLVGTGLAIGCLCLSFQTDGVKFSAMSE